MQLNQTTKTIITVLALLLVAAMTLYLFPRTASTSRYHCEIGKPWGYELMTAEFDFPIYKDAEQLEAEREEVLQNLVPCYVFDSTVNFRSPLIISLNEMEQLRREGYTRVSVVNNHVSKIHPLSDIHTPKTAYQQYQRDLPPNLLPDTAATNRMRAGLLASISPTRGMVQAGEKIIDRGDIVTPDNYQILISLRRAYEEEGLSRQQVIWSTTGKCLMVLLMISLFVLYLFVFRRHLLRDMPTMLFFCLIISIVIAISCLEIRFTTLSLYLIPFAWVPILTRIFYDARTALFLHIVTVVIVSFAAPAPYEFMLAQLAAGMVAVSGMQDISRRSQLAQTAGWILLTYAIVYTAFTLASTGTWHTIEPINYLYMLLNVLLVICGTYGLIFFLEKVFRLVSSITLVELTDINSGLLHELADRAPGTFQHSMQVSNLATEAAKRIGANALLVRTAALYHDIGKLSHPEYFTENQTDATNPLLDMSPQEAAAIIIQHTSDGVALAQQHRLPPVITRFIASHHGNSLVRYFYTTYANAHPDEQIDPQPFRYPGPQPTTKEEAILMMTDAIEARSRSLKSYTEKNISEMVDQMINQQIAEGQFAESAISFKDVEELRVFYKERLIAINHHRIKYPKLKTENK